FIDSESVDPSAIGLSPADYPFGAFEYVNRTHVRIYGLDLSGHWQFRPDWRLWTSISYAHGRDTDQDEALNSVAPLKGIFGIGYANQVWGSDLSLVLAAARNDVEDPSSDLNKLPGYGVVNLTAWWKPARIEGLTIQAGIFNLFDKKYWDTLEVPTTGSLSKDYYTAAGRSVKLAATYRF
ncbi:TonB-dependent receptor, partial [Thioclava sp. BHET1]